MAALRVRGLLQSSKRFSNAPVDGEGETHHQKQDQGGQGRHVRPLAGGQGLADAPVVEDHFQPADLIGVIAHGAGEDVLPGEGPVVARGRKSFGPGQELAVGVEEAGFLEIAVLAVAAEEAVDELLVELPDSHLQLGGLRGGEGQEPVAQVLLRLAGQFHAEHPIACRGSGHGKQHGRDEDGTEQADAPPARSAPRVRIGRGAALHGVTQAWEVWMARMAASISASLRSRDSAERAVLASVRVRCLKSSMSRVNPSWRSSESLNPSQGQVGQHSPFAAEALGGLARARAPVVQEEPPDGRLEILGQGLAPYDGVGWDLGRSPDHAQPGRVFPDSGRPSA